MFSFRSLYFDQKPVQGRALDFFDASTPEGDIQELSLFFIHGGGWHAGSRSNYHFAMHALAERGFHCASTDYRLKDVNIFDQVADVREGLDFFAEDLRRRNRPLKVVLVGGSAGAHLALLTGLAKPEEVGQPATPLRHSVEIAGIIPEAPPYTFEPWEDIFPIMWRRMQGAVGVPHAQRPELYTQLSPIHYVRAPMPPIFSMHAANECDFPYTLAEEFALKAAAVKGDFTTKTYIRAEHGFFYSFERWQQREAFKDILTFLEKLGARPTSPCLEKA